MLEGQVRQFVAAQAAADEQAEDGAIAPTHQRVGRRSKQFSAWSWVSQLPKRTPRTGTPLTRPMAAAVGWSSRPLSAHSSARARMAPRHSNPVDAAYGEINTALDHLSAALGSNTPRKQNPHSIPCKCLEAISGSQASGQRELFRYRARPVVPGGGQHRSRLGGSLGGARSW